MRNFRARLFEIYQTSVAITLTELARDMGLESDDPMGVLQEIESVLAEHKLEISPPLSSGSFDDVRSLYSPSFTVKLDQLIEHGEGHNAEFKSTAFANLNRMEKDPGHSPKKYMCDDVLNSALKTVAGFSNGNGGTILIGVRNSGEKCGIEKDLLVLGSVTADVWELRFRDRIKALFEDGKSLNSFVHIDMVKENDKHIVCVRVTPRRKLDFLKYQGKYCLYKRQGNSTIKIEYQEIENYFELNPRG